jgi:hypothetical protein
VRVSAGEVLLRAGIDRDALAVDLPSVDPSRVPVWAASRWFRILWAPWVTAVALPWGVYLHPKRFEAGPAELGPLVVHELAHIEQWRRLGAVRWFASYVGGYRRARRSGLDRAEAYRMIPLEVEARELARRHTPA